MVVSKRSEWNKRLLNCPFCDSRAGMTEEGYNCKYAECTECGANGPRCRTFLAAAMGWNRREKRSETCGA